MSSQRLYLSLKDPPGKSLEAFRCATVPDMMIRWDTSFGDSCCRTNSYSLTALPGKVLMGHQCLISWPTLCVIIDELFLAFSTHNGIQRATWNAECKSVHDWFSIIVHDARDASSFRSKQPVTWTLSKSKQCIVSSGATFTQYIFIEVFERRFQVLQSIWLASPRWALRHVLVTSMLRRGRRSLSRSTQTPPRNTERISAAIASCLQGEIASRHWGISGYLHVRAAVLHSNSWESKQWLANEGLARKMPRADWSKLGLIWLEEASCPLLVTSSFSRFTQRSSLWIDLCLDRSLPQQWK